MSSKHLQPAGSHVTRAAHLHIAQRGLKEITSPASVQMTCRNAIVLLMLLHLLRKQDGEVVRAALPLRVK